MINMILGGFCVMVFVLICVFCVIPIFHGIYVVWKERDNAFGQALACFILAMFGLSVAMLL